MKDRKAISVMVSYALLIVIVIGLSLFAYAYLKLYLPSKRPQCPDNLNLFIDSAVCSRQSKKLDLTISNRGFFNVSLVYLRFGEAKRQIRAQLNPGNEALPISISPGQKAYAFSFDISNLLKDETDYVIEVQPAVLSDNTIIICENSITKFPVKCPIRIAGHVCGEGHVLLANGNCSAIFDLPVEDGVVQLSDGVYTKDILSETILFGTTAPQNYARGFVEWNISTIPSNAVIKEVFFSYEGEENTLSGDESSIYSIETQPSVSLEEQSIYNDAGEGNLYLRGIMEFPQISQSNVGGSTGILWTNSPVPDLQSAVSSGKEWFAIGFITSENYVNEYAEISSAESTNFPPTLKIIYTP